METAFERDAEAYLRELPKLILEDQERKFVVICGAKVQSVFESRSSAFNWAYGKYGRDPFIVKQVLQSDLERSSPAETCPACG